MKKKGKRCWVIIRDANTFRQRVDALVAVVGLSRKRARCLALEADAFGEVDVFEGDEAVARRIADELNQRLWRDKAKRDDSSKADGTAGADADYYRIPRVMKVGEPDTAARGPFAGRVVAMDCTAGFLLARAVAARGAVVRLLDQTRGVARGYRRGGGVVRQGCAPWGDWPDAVIHRESRLDAVVLANALEPANAQPLVPTLPVSRRPEDASMARLVVAARIMRLDNFSTAAAALMRQARGSLVVATAEPRTDGLPHAAQLLEHAVNLCRPQLEANGVTVRVVRTMPYDAYKGAQKPSIAPRKALLAAVKECLGS